MEKYISRASEAEHDEDISRMEKQPAAELRRDGEVQLFQGDDVVLIPTPSTDPKDPLNYPQWKKRAILILVSAYSTTAVLLSSGMGAILSKVKLSYPGEEQRANDLMTHPALFMGVGNLFSVPLSMVIGRRPVFLFSIILLVVGGVWCAMSTSLGSHIAGRNVMSIAAGQSESLAPLMVQEMHFLHNRSRQLGWLLAIQTMGVGAFLIATQYLVMAYGWKWWYGLFTIVNGVILLLSLPLAAETSYNRAPSVLTGHTRGGSPHEPPAPAITASQHKTMLASMQGRSWSDGLALFSKRDPWKSVGTFYWQLLQGFFIWPIFLIFLINGAYLGIYVFQSATFAQVLIMPPYSVDFIYLCFVQGAQIIVSLICLPVLGYGSDAVVKFLSKRNDSFHKPEYRFVIFIIPATVGIVSAVIFGQAAAVTPFNPQKWSWASIAVPFNGIYFAFVGAAIMGLTYAVDSFPDQAGPLLVLICAGRGIVSFGLSYATLPALQSVGIDGLMNILATICGVLSLLLIPAYFLGQRSRSWAKRHLFKAEVNDRS
ncbi:major facilitator superfamily protein [Sarocladium implicatum]|nr:major facilitator superfamily protein [Sarocladium implicatum]